MENAIHTGRTPVRKQMAQFAPARLGVAHRTLSKCLLILNLAVEVCNFDVAQWIQIFHGMILLVVLLGLLGLLVLALAAVGALVVVVIANVLVVALVLAQTLASAVLIFQVQLPLALGRLGCRLVETFVVALARHLMLSLKAAPFSVARKRPKQSGHFSKQRRLGQKQARPNSFERHLCCGPQNICNVGPHGMFGFGEEKCWG